MAPRILRDYQNHASGRFYEGCIREPSGPLQAILGPEDVMLLLIPVALTGLAVWLAWSRSACSTWTRLAQWGLGALCLVYCSVPLLFVPEVDISFIGVFFLPATLVLLVSAITAALRAKL